MGVSVAAQMDGSNHFPANRPVAPPSDRTRLRGTHSGSRVETPEISRRVGWRSTSTLGIVFIAVIGPLAASAYDSNPDVQRGRGKMVAMQPLGAGFAPAPGLAQTGPHLTYYGGRVVSNMQVVQVLWGSGDYWSEVSGLTSPSMATFYHEMLNGRYVDWLREYGTVGLAGGSNQVIGRGDFVGQYTITPSTAAATIDDSEIQAELASQIAANHLPLPTTDAAGNTNTYYAIFFPAGIEITLGGSDGLHTCLDFCGSHGTIASVDGHEIYYGLHPDCAATACEGGPFAQGFDNLTRVASHEMVETITDPEIRLASVEGPPLAWWDATNGEAADFCGGFGHIVGGDRFSYAVTEAWSNLANRCIAAQPDNDGDGLDDTVDPCTNPLGRQNFLAATHPRLTLVNTGDPLAGNDRLTLEAIFRPTGSAFQFSPAVYGARLIVQNHAGTTRVDVALSAGEYAGKGTRGWAETHSHGGWKFTDATADPANGITSALLQTLRKRSAGEVRVRISGRHGTYPIVAGDEPLRAIVVIGNQAAATAGYCGESTFGAADCVFKGKGRTLRCRQ